MRVRGLKFIPAGPYDKPRRVSHPMRVRGLKFYIVDHVEEGQESHPMRVRGLKSSYSLDYLADHLVAPHAGAWIEMELKQSKINWEAVAPHAGAWIEINALLAVEAAAKSHPMRVRGLKFAQYNNDPWDVEVAPHAGAWIEI